MILFLIEVAQFSVTVVIDLPTRASKLEQSYAFSKFTLLYTNLTNSNWKFVSSNSRDSWKCCPSLKTNPFLEMRPAALIRWAALLLFLEVVHTG